MRPEIIEFSDGIPVQTFIGFVEHYPYHWHDALEIVQVLKGSVDISLGNEELHLNENDIAIVNMNELHRINKTAQQDHQLLIIHIDSVFFKSLLPEGSYLFLYCCSTNHGQESFARYRQLTQHVRDLLLSINDKSSKDYQATVIQSLKRLLDYITYYFDFLRWGYGAVAFDEKHVERLRQIAAHIVGAQGNIPKLKDVASKVSLSVHHLSHDISEKFGYTFQELMFYIRIEQAAKMLLSTDQRIIDIAQECHFSDPKYLVKHFKMNFGMTPSQFRKNYQKDTQKLVYQSK